jgi:hypothetical protein
MASNGKAAPAGVVVPEIKFTKLFINGDFVDAASGTHKYTCSSLGLTVPFLSFFFIPNSELIE